MRRAGNTGLVRLPPHGERQAIGLFGGSFNPPHAGHLLASRLALTRIGLDKIWWLATPGNPLKSHGDLAALRARLEAAHKLVRDPRIAVTGIESEIGATFTADSLAYLVRRAPGVRFVWIMGADNLKQLHLWRRWRQIAALAPILVIDRPGSSFAPLSARAAQAMARWRVPEADARRLAYLKPPAWIFLHARRSGASSTALRAQPPESQLREPSISAGA